MGGVGVGGEFAIVGESANEFRGETVRVRVEKSTHLTYYKPIFQFYASWKYRCSQYLCSLTIIMKFSGGRKLEHWIKTGASIIVLFEDFEWRGGVVMN